MTQAPPLRESILCFYLPVTESKLFGLCLFLGWRKMMMMIWKKSM